MPSRTSSDAPPGRLTGQGLLLTLGPGLLWAGAAIGVSHLVQSTRAGAAYGFALVWAVLLANAAKYPFFEFASRYACATGESLLDGYARNGRWMLWLFLGITLGTMLTVQAAVTLVAAAVLGNIVPLGITWLSAGLLCLCMAIIAVGRYSALDRLMKGIILVLSASTIAAVAASLGSGPAAPSEFSWTAPNIAFLVALMGWMPSPIDLSVWTSLWCQERRKETAHRPSLREAQLDIGIGYAVTTLLALGFLSLGALVMHGSGESFSPRGTAFVGQFVDMYAQSLGGFMRPVILLAALATMLSTTLTVLDGYSRALPRTVELLSSGEWSSQRRQQAGAAALAVMGLGGLSIILFFASRMTALVDLATTLSFLPAPLLASMNHRVVTSEHTPEEYRPGPAMLAWSYAGMGFLALFSLFWIASRFLQW